MDSFSRRTFLMRAAALSLLMLCDIPHVFGAVKPALYLTHKKEMEKFSGDIYFNQMHTELLGKKRDGKRRSYPASWNDEKIDVIIVGGGIAGLSTAFLLLDSPAVKKSGAVVRLFEMDDEVGGTSKEYEWEGIPYSNSAAYFYLSEPESPCMTMYRKTGIVDEVVIPDDDNEMVLTGDKICRDFFNRGRGDESPEHEASGCRQAVDFFTVMNSDQLYPEVPFTPGGAYSPAEFKSLDCISFGYLLDRRGTVKTGRRESAIPVIPSVFKEFIENFCYSSFGCSMYGISAWQGLSWFASEFDKNSVGVLPGGNGRISTRLRQKIDELDSRCIVTSRPVVDVRCNPSRRLCNVTVAENRDTRETSYRTCSAPFVVMSCPLFVSRRILSNELSPRLISSVDSLSYSAYIVTNAFINTSLLEDYWSIYCLDTGPDMGKKGEACYRDKPFMDIVNASWAPGKLLKAEKPLPATVLTMYSPHPFDGQRRDMLKDSYCNEFKIRVRKELIRRIGPQGLSDSSIRDIRLARWGHAMLQARPGLCSSGILNDIRMAGARKGIYFACTDMLGAPSIENSFHAAWSTAEAISQRLSGKRKSAFSSSFGRHPEQAVLSS